jgi:tight adherence protein C
VSPAIAGIGAVCVFALAIVGVVELRADGLRRRLLAEPAARPRRRSGWEALLEALGALTGPLVLRTMRPERRNAVLRRLAAGGRVMTLDEYAAKKGATGALFALAAAAMTTQGLWLAAAPVALVGVSLVDVSAARAARLRQERIDRDLPDFLDILAVCVNAGIPFRPAMVRVATAIGGPVAQEISGTLQEMELGSGRREALEALRRRNPSEFVASFTTALLQAEELGVPLAAALSDLARDMRQAAYQRARTQAQKAAPRVSLIVTTIMVPAAVLLMLGGMVIGSDVDFGAIFGNG